MKKWICILLTCGLLAGIPVGSFAAADEGTARAAYRVYVDAAAKTPGDGSKARPFSTLAEAKIFVRMLDKTKGDIVVEIADGVYTLDETLVFDEADSGSASCTVRYVAAPGASPVISGGDTVTGEWRDEGNGIFSIAFDRDRKLRALYVNGERRYMTSKVVKAWGGYGEYTVSQGEDDYAWVSGTAKSAVRFIYGSIPADTRNADDIELMTQTRWNTTIVCVDHLERKGLFLGAQLQMPYSAIAQTLGWGNEYQFNQNNMVYNVFEWLDEPGEFYFDKTEKRLYYYPLDGEDLAAAQVVVPRLESLIKIQGQDLTHRVQYLSFEGLEFAYTDWNLNQIAGSCGRATNQGAASLQAYAPQEWHNYIYRAYDVGPAAVQVRSAAHIRFFGNTICHTGNDGLSLVNDVTETTVQANAIYDTAGASLLVGHPQHVYIGDRGTDKGWFSDREKYSAEEEGVCKNLTITDNLFKDTSRLFWGVAGVMVYFAENMLFQYNQVENTPYSGISLGWGWWNMNGSAEAVVPGEPSNTMKNNTIKNNRFLNTITTLSDAGAIYTIGDMPGTVISENYIQTIGAGKSAVYHIRGIHIDEGTQHVYGEKNVIDIDPELTCIDCGDWGNKGNNRWDNNYSTSASYTTTETFEPGTVITNAHTVPDADWDKTALAVIENAGIQDEYKALLPAYILEETPTIIQTIPEYNYVPMIVGLSVVGAALVATAAGFGIKAILRRRNKKKEQ